ncbi:MAG: TIGR04282 family arsenosugar biosynthesis glycosyltransferase [Desulfuromonadales bacterium]|nr:TIGR04282 family arsenosugar biosynthesis glycosyltransferase [Desulfuromonadales bacterium]
MDKPVNKVDNSTNSHIINHSGAVIGLFAKEPVAGQVKTRLTPPLSAAQACLLYRVALQETLSRLLTAGTPVVICYAGRRDWFSANFPGLPLLAQTGDDLGVRMSNAAQALFAAGGGPVLLAGSDSPDLPISLVRQVVIKLQEVDVSIVPCHDGGYAIVGMRRPSTALFAEIPWSTSRVLEATRQRSRELGLTYHETESWDDLDEFADLRRLVARSPGSITARHIVTELSGLL